MRSRNRDINAFSVSALDLFASALGAFILMSVVLMPYFLRVDPEEVQKLERRLKEAQAEHNATKQKLQQSQTNLQQAQQKSQKAQKDLKALQEAPKLMFPNLDVVIALDTTGSMRSVVDGLRQDIDQFAKLMLELAPAVGIGVIDFKDRCDPSTAVREFALRRINSSSLPSLRSFTGSMATVGASCNPDKPEALASALDAAIASNWRSDSQARIIVIITDNPAYANKMASSIAAARSFAARGPGHKVSTVFTDTGSSLPGTQAYLRSLAEAGNGNFTQSGRSFVVTMLFALAGL